jgi:hypothetical protein
MGLPTTAAQMMGNVLQQTRYKLKTGHGISEEVYFSTIQRRILGSGQGSGASPCIWTLVLDPILSSVSEKYDCFHIITPTKKSINRIGDVFVDDTALFLILSHLEDSKNITPDYIASKMEEIAQDFERKLHSTGGGLSLQKCFWYLIHWTWDEEGNAHMSKIHNSPTEINLTKGSFSTKHTIKREEINQARRTIGVQINPTGKPQDEYNFRLKYTREWQQMIASTRLTKKESLNAYRTVFIPSISYPLGAIYLSPENANTSNPRHSKHTSQK